MARVREELSLQHSAEEKFLGPDELRLLRELEAKGGSDVAEMLAGLEEMWAEVPEEV